MVRQSFNLKIKRKKVEVIDICITLPIVLILAAIYAKSQSLYHPYEMERRNPVGFHT